jgi:hypothetical protein
MSVDVELSSLPARINLYLNSVNRTIGDKPSSFEMVMVNSLITADTNEIFFLNVIQFNTFNNFYQVQKGYNTDFEILIYNHDNEFHDSIIGEIPEGNLTVYDILNYLKVLLSGIINISYDKIKNKFIFTAISSNANHAYIYLNIINCDLLLGFSRLKRLKPILLEHNINIYSEQPINVISITNIFVHVSGDLYLNDENYDNHNSSEIDNNNIIFSMAIDKPFNTCLSYNNIDGGNSFYYRLDNSKANINRFKLEIKDQFNQIIPNFPEYNMIMQFTKKTRENVFLRPLIDIKNYLSQLYLMFGTIYQKLLR